MAIFALVFGGDSLESDISVITYKKIKKQLVDEKIDTLDVYLDRTGKFYIYDNNKVREGEFKKTGELCYFKTKFKKYYFDIVLPLVHGKGVEDGTLGAYFDVLKIPCLYSGITNSSLLQNKSYLKKVLTFYQIPNVSYVELTYEQFVKVNFDLNNHIKSLKFPLIVKPNNLGSSIGVKKVYELDNLLKALDEAFSYDNEVIIEECIENLKEVNIAILGYKNNLICSELETVSNKDEVLSFFDKYLLSKDKVTRIIPSDISLLQKEIIIEISKKAFTFLNCFGVVRFDYLLDQNSGKIYLNEINTIPGSLAYYLFEPLNLSVGKIVQIMFENYLKKKKEELRLRYEYNEGDKKDLLSKE